MDAIHRKVDASCYADLTIAWAPPHEFFDRDSNYGTCSQTMDAIPPNFDEPCYADLTIADVRSYEHPYRCQHHQGGPFPPGSVYQSRQQVGPRRSHHPGTRARLHWERVRPHLEPLRLRLHGQNRHTRTLP